MKLVRLNQLLVVLFFIFGSSLVAQNITAPLHSNDEYTIQRLSILFPQNEMHTAIRPYRREDLVKLGRNYLKNVAFSPLDKSNIQHLFNQNNEFDSIPELSKKPMLNHFYKTPAHLFELNSKDFYLKVNPILYLGMGKSSGEEGLLYINQRGFQIRGGIDQKVYFSTQLLESQVRFPNFVNSFTSQFLAVPGAGLYKNYNLAALNVSGGRDFLISNAYVGFNVSKHIGLQFGHGTNFIGDGFRSLLISDFSSPYLYLKVNTRVWKIHYQNLFAELAVNGTKDDRGDDRIPRKYLAGHYLSFNLRPNLTFGIYEAIIFSRGKNRFELQYLNPIIFYRTIEGAIGSPDNALLGATANWKVKNTFSLYGQFMLDDILVRNVFNGKIGWWGNKWGVQVGAKYLNAFGIDHLDAQIEYNSVRPYTFSHRDSTASYSHFNQPLAHPLGANFNEVMFSMNYQPLEKLFLKAKLFLISSGDDIGDVSYGSNVILPNNRRLSDFGNTIGQGDATQTSFVHLTASYELKHNMFLELVYGNRNKTTDSGTGDLKSGFITGTIRWNFNRQPNIF